MPQTENKRKLFLTPNVIVNLSSDFRREIRNGIEYAVFPAIMLVEGVHHGAVGGPVYYSAELLGQNVEAWNGMPIPVQHPQNADGDYVMCSEPGVEKEWSIGFVDNARLEEGQLKADLWINITLCRQRHPDLLSLLQSNEQVEVSTGLWAMHDEIPGEWNGETYDASVVNITPDHLALLPGGTGACNWDDGCGIRFHTTNTKGKERGMLNYVNEQKKLVLKDGGEFNKADMVKFTPLPNEVSHDGIRRELSAHVDSLDKFDGDGAYTEINFVVAVFDDYFVYSTESKDGRTLHRQDYSVVNDSVDLDEEIMAVTEVVSYVAVSNDANTNEEDSTMPCCPKKVEAIIANEKSGYTEDDRAFLESATDVQLDNVIALLPTEQDLNTDLGDEGAAAAANASDASDAPVTVDTYLKNAPAEIKSVLAEGQRQLDHKRSELISGIMANDRSTFTEPALKAMELDQLEKLANLANVPVYVGLDNSAAVVNGADDEAPYESAPFGAGLKQ